MRTVDKIALAHLPGIIASGAVVISWAAGASAAAVAVLNSVLALVMVGTLTSLTVIALGQAKK